jgi:hypothetical protein
MLDIRIVAQLSLIRFRSACAPLASVRGSLLLDRRLFSSDVPRIAARLHWPAAPPTDPTLPSSLWGLNGNAVPLGLDPRGEGANFLGDPTGLKVGLPVGVLWRLLARLPAL